MSFHRTGLVKIEIERFSHGRIVMAVQLEAGNETLSASEECGPFEGISDALEACVRLSQGWLRGQFPDVLLSEFQA